MIKLFTLTLATLATMCSPVMAWDIKEMNAHIDQTNFIVGRGCSGTLIDLERRLILTNYHCIASQVKTKQTEDVAFDGTVTTRRITDTRPVDVHQRVYDGHEMVSSAAYITELVSWDINIDLALLQFRSETLPFNREAVLATEPVMRGEVAWVIGNPLGLENTVMRGVVSSTNRLLVVGGKELPYIQVDAGITGGSSGGALYNDDGIMIGVPAASAPGTVVGLAIPMTYVLEFLEEACYMEVYDEEAEVFEVCSAPESDSEDDEDTSVPN